MKPFTSEFLTKNVLELIFKRGDVFKESRRAQDKSSPEYLYQYGKRCNYFIIILTGEATIEVGFEKLEFIAGQFAYFGVNALVNDGDSADQILKSDKQHHYTPDFSLRVDDRCVYFKIERDLWFNGVRKSKYEVENSEMCNNIDINVSQSLNSNDCRSSIATNNTNQTLKKLSSYGQDSKSNTSLNVNTNNLDSQDCSTKSVSSGSVNENMKKSISNNSSNLIGFIKSSDKKNKSSEYIELISYKEENDV